MELAEILSFRRAYRSTNLGEASKLSYTEAQEIEEALDVARKRMGKYDNDLQVLGRRDPIGCVALEITQRCNLDCTLCYLSENSEDVKDIPIEELYRRLDEIKQAYGPGTVVQVTGGDPTLRERSELVAIVRKARELGLQPALFTNGIKATRDMLEELSSVGLVDVAFHVDMTQERVGYNSEVELNKIREEYIERARGLPLTIIFNTTVFDKNFHEVPELIKFFRKNSDAVRFVSFQLQADAGRGELTKRGPVISVETIRDQINRGADASLNWDPMHFGHPHCHSFAYSFAVNGNLYNMIENDRYLADGLEDFKHVFFDRRQGTLKNFGPFLRVILKKPRWLYRIVCYILPLLWRARADLIASRGKVGRLSFFIHNFMDSDNLDAERVEACSFMVMTPDGPVSMCAHNAKRDEYILRPIEIQSDNGSYIWNPLRDKLRKKRKARGQRQWKDNDKLNVVPENESISGGCGGCH